MTVPGHGARAALLGLLLGTAAGCADYSAASRFRTMPAQDDVIAAGDWYRPVMRVAGRTGGNLAFDAGSLGNQGNRSAVVSDAMTAVAQEWDSFAVVVIQDRRVAFEYYQQPAGPAFRFDSQSMHRALLALALGAALESGAISSLDASVADYLPEWRADERSRVTLRDLLYHQSGFVDPPYQFAADSPGMQLFIGTQLEALLLAQQPQTAPGRAFRGAALDAQLLGLILERSTGAPYAELLSRAIWQPIGAQDAFVRLDRPGGSTRTFCCLSATARDWARVGQLMLDGGRVGTRQVVPVAWIQQLLTPSKLNTAFGGYWALQAIPLTPRSVAASAAPPVATPFTSPDVYYAGGRGGQRVYVIPSRQTVVVRFGKIRNDFDDGAFLNPILAAL